MCSSPWARKESDKTKLLNETELNPLQYSDGHELAHGLMNNSRYLPGSLAGWETLRLQVHSPGSGMGVLADGIPTPITLPTPGG